MRMRRAKRLVGNRDPRLRSYTFAIRCWAYPVYAFFVLLATPLLGNFFVIWAAGLMGCRTGEDDIHACHFVYWDIGEFIYGYVVDIFVLGAANPLLAFYALKAFLSTWVGLAWLFAAVALYVARALQRNRLERETRPPGPPPLP